MCFLLVLTASIFCSFQVLIHHSLYLVIGVYSAPLVICVIASFLLKIETAGKALQVYHFVFIYYIYPVKVNSSPETASLFIDIIFPIHFSPHTYPS